MQQLRVPPAPRSPLPDLRTARSRPRGRGCPAPARPRHPRRGQWRPRARAPRRSQPSGPSFRAPGPRRLLPRPRGNACTFHCFLHHLVVAIHGGGGPRPAPGRAAASRPSGCSRRQASAGAEPGEFGGGGGRGGAAGAWQALPPLQPLQFRGLQRLPHRPLRAPTWPSPPSRRVSPRPPQLSPPMSPLCYRAADPLTSPSARALPASLIDSSLSLPRSEAPEARDAPGPRRLRPSRAVRRPGRDRLRLGALPARHAVLAAARFSPPLGIAGYPPSRLGEPDAPPTPTPVPATTWKCAVQGPPPPASKARGCLSAAPALRLPLASFPPPLHPLVTLAAQGRHAQDCRCPPAPRHTSASPCPTLEGVSPAPTPVPPQSPRSPPSFASPGRW
jgi:hypothetical protein